MLEVSDVQNFKEYEKYLQCPDRTRTIKASPLRAKEASPTARLVKHMEGASPQARSVKLNLNPPQPRKHLGPQARDLGSDNARTLLRQDDAAHAVTDREAGAGGPRPGRRLLK